MENKNLYKLIGKIALEYRLSLKNVCKILGKEATEENKMDFYNKLSMAYDNDIYVIKKFKYLFFYETLTEKESLSKIALTRATNFVKRYNKAKKDGDNEQISKLMDELNKTEKDFKMIESKIQNQRLTKEDIDIISRYRIKHAISRVSFTNHYCISNSSLEKRDKFTEDEYLKNKLNLLSDYFYDVSIATMKKRK